MVGAEAASSDVALLRALDAKKCLASADPALVRGAKRKIRAMTDRLLPPFTRRRVRGKQPVYTAVTVLPADSGADWSAWPLDDVKQQLLCVAVVDASMEHHGSRMCDPCEEGMLRVIQCLAVRVPVSIRTSTLLGAKWSTLLAASGSFPWSVLFSCLEDILRVTSAARAWHRHRLRQCARCMRESTETMWARGDWEDALVLEGRVVS